MRKLLNYSYHLSLICSLLVFSFSANAARVDRYVDEKSANPESPYDSWDNAATDIQTAVDAADASQGDEVIVRAGIYDQGGRVSGITNATYGASLLTNRVVIRKAITLRSENNDPENTIIKGAWHPGTTNGASAVRCVYLGSSNAKLIGFTLTNGATLNLATVLHAGNSAELNAGGVFSTRTATVISNCIIVGNAGLGTTYQGNSGGGAYLGTYYNCRIWDVMNWFTVDRRY